MQYKVLIYPQPFEYNEVEAKSPEDAEDLVIRNAYHNYDDILKTEVFITCNDCNYDNKTDATVCDSCNEKLTTTS